METKEILEGLKNSSFTPVFYKPTRNIKSLEHVVIYANNIPLVGVGASNDTDTMLEAKSLVNSKRLQELAEHDFGEAVTLSVKIVDGNKIKWKDEEIGICKSEVGKEENDNEEAPLHWIVFGNNSKGLATAMCLSQDIQRIAI